MKHQKMVFIIGPTASGKTRIAALAANTIGAEIISADSRQVYRGMDIGSGKDIKDYEVEGAVVPSHIIDIAEAGSKYSIFDYRQDFEKAYSGILERGNAVVVCGGSGMYIETALGLYNLTEAPTDDEFRRKAEQMSDKELVNFLSTLTNPHNTTDITDRNRLIRAIEVAKAAELSIFAGEMEQKISSANQHLIFGIGFPREITRKRITQRLETRLKEGMLDEVDQLLKKGISADDLKYYGLEYRYLTMHLTGEIDYQEMFRLLNTAIHQFAKRQMTWFRRMEKRGVKIQWLDGLQMPEHNAAVIAETFLRDR